MSQSSGFDPACAEQANLLGRDCAPGIQIGAAMQQALDQLDRLECIMDPEHARKVAVLGLPWETRWAD